MTGKEEVDRYLEYLQRIKGLSENTVSAYKRDLDKLLAFVEENNIDICSLSKDDALYFISMLMDSKLDSFSVNRALSTYRGFYTLLYRDKRVPFNPFGDIKNSKAERKLPTYLTKEELDSVFDTVNSEGEDFEGIRNRALFHLFYSTGARRAEIASINIEDINFASSEILIKGKGNKMRFVYISDDAKYMLNEYIKVRREFIREDLGPLFISRKGKGLSTSDINIIFRKEKEKFGLGKNITPHTLRHTYATHLLENDMDIRVLQELMGHSSISTTGIYTHLSLKELKNVYKKTHPHA